MKKNIKHILISIWNIESHIRSHITLSSWFGDNIPIIGKAFSIFMDRILLSIYGIDLMSMSIKVAVLSISHPAGVLLGGNGIVSSGRVAIMAGVKFVARRPSDEEYLRKHKDRQVFRLGDNVVIGANSVLIGPIHICDNVIIGAMSLINKDITESGVYVGSPARKISTIVTDEWFNHLDPAPAKNYN
jgi:serine acetyltransferase